jgi:hypothetical protein
VLRRNAGFRPAAGISCAVEVIMAQEIPKISEEEIRLRSYLIWQHEGCPKGAELAHWLRAKAELEAEHGGKFPRSHVFFRSDGPHPMATPQLPVPPRLTAMPPPKRTTAARVASRGGATAARR